MAQTIMPTGGGVEMNNSTSDSLTQSLASLSADMAAHGMSFNLAPVSPKVNTVTNPQEKKSTQKSCVEIVPAKKSFPMYIDCKMGHGLSPDDPMTGYCPSDFGVAGNLTTDEVNEYLASRAAFFFQSIMNDSASMLQGTSKFISCEDFRFSAGACAIEKNNDDCKGNDICAKNPEEEYSKYLIIRKN